MLSRIQDNKRPDNERTYIILYRCSALGILNLMHYRNVYKKYIKWFVPLIAEFL